MSFTLVTPDGKDREVYPKLFPAFVRAGEYLDAGWRSVGIRDDRDGSWPIVCAVRADILDAKRSPVPTLEPQGGNRRWTSSK